MSRIALLVIPMAFLAGCCGYGGPGCGDPAVVGICAGQVPLGESIVTVNYGDDTGYHPTDYGRVWAGPGELLSARAGGETGEVILAGQRVGHAWFRVGPVPGWDESQQFQFSVKVVEQVVESACDEYDRYLLPDRTRE